MFCIVACRTRVVLCFKRQVVKFFFSIPISTGADEPAPTNRRRRLARVRIYTPSQSSGLVNRGASRTLAHRPCSWHPATPAPGRRRRCVGAGAAARARARARARRSPAPLLGIRAPSARAPSARAPHSAPVRARAGIPLSCQTRLLRPSAKSHRWAGNLTRGASRC
jgi:hypothetical protein